MHSLPLAPLVERVIQELPAIVCVQLSQREWQALTDMMYSCAYSLLAQAPNSLGLCPSRSHIYGYKRSEVEAFGTLPTVEHQVCLQRAYLGMLPFSEGANGHQGLDSGEGCGLPEGPAQRALPERSEDAIYSSSTEAKQLASGFLFHLQFPVVLQRSEELGEEGLQALGAHIV